MDHCYLGADFAPQETEKEAASYRLPVHRPDDVVTTTARLLAKGAVIGWFQGRAEFGPRALGNRSILADPRLSEMKEIVNSRIKFWEEFRPFAPAVSEEQFSDYFEGCPANPFMTFSANVIPSKREIIPAVTHVDSSARPQAVKRSTNPKFADLVRCFGQDTGVPVVLNTSFNVKGEPIVNSPTDAIRCFYSTGIDYLVIDDLILCKGNAEQIAD